MFMTRVVAAYTMVKADALDNQFTKLAADIIALEYAPAEEQKLLNILKEAYQGASKAKRTKSIAVTAEINWDAVIKENRAKQEAMKKMRNENNQRTMESLKRPSISDSPDQSVTKRKVAHEVEQMGNIIKFDFKHPEKKDGFPEVKPDVDVTDRMYRIKNSLQKISVLMTELKKKSAAENKKKPAKSTSRPRTYGKGTKKTARKPKRKAG